MIKSPIMKLIGGIGILFGGALLYWGIKGEIIFGGVVLIIILGFCLGMSIYFETVFTKYPILSVINLAVIISCTLNFFEANEEPDILLKKVLFGILGSGFAIGLFKYSTRKFKKDVE